MAIHLLPDQLIQQIAAGQVIETPADIIKELLENALDAGANKIKIFLRNSGLEQIIITDNGLGMNKYDLELATLPHSTSKLKTFEEIYQLTSFGFRGEALASIAQVSSLEIKTKNYTDEHGWQIKNNFGQLSLATPAGTPDGTHITINDLFANYPARKKFLHSRAKQLRLILETITQIALAHPQVRFFLSNDHKTLLNLPEQTLELRCKNLLGSRIFNGLINFTGQEDTFKIVGFLTHPQLARSTQLYQYFYVNRRPVKNFLLNKTIKQAYEGRIKKTDYPPFLLFLDLPADQVDVNVHPQKIEVAFADEAKLTQFLLNQISHRLNELNLVHHQNADLAHHPAERISGDYQYFKQELTLHDKSFDIKIDEPILQINNLYLAIEEPDGLLLIDQHAAHERVLFEQLSQQFQTEQSKIVNLAKPVLLELNPLESSILEEHLTHLANLGFKMENFYPQTYQILTSPQIFLQRDLAALIKGLLQDLHDHQLKIDEISLELINYLACRGAIKDNQYLTPDERQKLVQELKACQNPYNCPHGRPTMIKINKNELAKMFKRR